jgi:uroporphyrinogen-III synthase
MPREWKIVLTRPAEQSAALAKMLGAAGFSAVVLPAIEIQQRITGAAVAEACRALGGGKFDCVLFTSANGVRLLRDAFAAAGIAAPALPDGIIVGAVGEATAREVERVWKRAAEVLSDDGTSAGLARALCAEGPVTKMRVLAPGPEEGRPDLREYLTNAGATVTEIPLYCTADAPLPGKGGLAGMFPEGGRSTTVFSFFSPSAVHSLWRREYFRAVLASAKVFSIGPVTSAAAREVGLSIWAEADKPSDESFMSALRSKCRAN